mmetsp:Transcript_2828/g.7439  ORF Transcript_2828/g.7439 Transcript_2828/m.7439 type:complete len:226 (-) Transcript_2828:78-755(-)
MDMETFGKLLAPLESFNMREPIGGDGPGLEAGTVPSLPGGVVHAGPESSGHRAILFFSARPKGNADEYHPDTQKCGPILASEIVRELWERLSVEYRERQFLLLRLVRHIKNYPRPGLHNHFQCGDFAEFVRQVECNPGVESSEQGELANATALNEKLFDIRQSPLRTDPLSVGLGSAVPASVDGLAALWEDAYFDVVVYWRSGDHFSVGVPKDVALCYPADVFPQ